jgi:transposase
MTVGVDVSKDWLDVAVEGQVTRFANDLADIQKLLSSIRSTATVAMEATGKYYKLLADTALSEGHRVYVLNPKDVHRYSAATSPRASTDQIAARVIAEFASIREHREYKPNPQPAQQIKEFARARTRLVTAKVAYENQISENPTAREFLAPAIEGTILAIKNINSEITQLAKQFPEFALLKAIPGFGELTSAYILALLLCGVFTCSDSFVAFLGLDTKVKQSGKKAGRRCLTKRGDPEARRLLYLAARAAVRRPGPYQDIYNRAIANGWPKTAAAVIVARKLARTAWALYTRHEPYSPDRVCNQHTQLQQAQPLSPGLSTSLSCRSRQSPARSAQTKRSHSKKTTCTIDNST